MFAVAVLIQQMNTSFIHPSFLHNSDVSKLAFGFGIGKNGKTV